jgi:hypothetical protein
MAFKGSVNLTLNAYVTSCEPDTVCNSVKKKSNRLIQCVKAVGSVRMSDPIERTPINRSRNGIEPLADKSNRQRDRN